MTTRSEEVIWHDLECGNYTEDHELWLAVATETGGPVLDVGAGTGRISLWLAERGVEVTASDLEAEFLEVLVERAGTPIPTLATDARDLGAVAGAGFGAVIVPMQTLQLLPGVAARREFYAGARAALRDGGLLVAALAEAMDGYSETDEDVLPPLPDMRELDGVVYASRPIAVRDEGDAAVIVRVREVVERDGTHRSTGNEIRLERIDTDQVAFEAADHGFAREPDRMVPQTDEYVGSQVVVLRAVPPGAGGGVTAPDPSQAVRAAGGGPRG